MKSKKIFACLLLVVAALMCSAADVRANASSEQRFLPIIMYHNVLNARKGKYIVSPRQLEDDIIALKNAGYQTVFPSEVISFCRGEGELPGKPILITFDDGHYNNYHYGLPILQRHSAKAVVNVIGAFTQFTTESGDCSNPNYSHLTWEQIAELSKSGHFEIGNHTYNMHKYKPRFGISQAAGESVEAYEQSLKSDILKMQGFLMDKSKVDCTVFAYPFGKYSSTSKRILRGFGFKMILTCSEGVNVIRRGNEECLLSLRRYNRDGGFTSDRLIKCLERGTKALEG